MNRMILRALNGPGLVLIAILGVAIQTSFFATWPLMYLQPDLILILAVWCALKRSFTEGGILVLIFSNIAEIHSSSPSGLFMICYMTIYLIVRMLNKVLVIPNFSSIVLLTMGASIFWKLEYLGILHLLGMSANQWRHTLVLLLPGAVMEGIAAIWIYRWLDRFDWITVKSPRAQQMMEDEMVLEGEGL